MSDGDDETPADDGEASETTEITVDSLDERLESAESALADAETESDLDTVEGVLDDIESDIESAELPEPDDEDEEAPAESLTDRLSGLRDDLEAQRGPYAEDVIDDIESSVSKIEDTRWTEQGADEIADAVAEFAEAAGEILDGDFAPQGHDEESLVAALDSVATTVEAAGLDPDEDDETIAALLEATDALSTGLEDAQEWDDLETNEQLMAEGFYDVLGHFKDFPVEWSALKEWEQRSRPDMVLLALNSLQSDFMERHCLETFQRMGQAAKTEAVVDQMLQRAGKRDKPAIRILGKMAAEEAVETLVEYVDADKDPQLQKVTFKALGEIGDEAATQPIADKLDSDNPIIRSQAARALGLLGDTRAVDPLSDVLADDEEDTVRTSAAWALRQIGTETALEAAAEYTGDRAYNVQMEAESASEALDAGTPTA
ncbi:HEAT repeat domain-containing protein [Salinirubrum litoreum]|uniref:HEAT repeat domain-containing protein n=1 Tax=Salinirubrum litoreum TaxID=1126234 RepID=A0ABD5RBK5_9EURY|nr:HEAT repeat domain-containing protein [Salinirubrum litoreum]